MPQAAPRTFHLAIPLIARCKPRVETFAAIVENSTTAAVLLHSGLVKEKERKLRDSYPGESQNP
jgi:hypothetical protein